MVVVKRARQLVEDSQLPTKRQFDLMVGILFFGTVALGLPKLWAARKLSEGTSSKPVTDVAGFVIQS
jgi:hypothetical protein